jgi:hypothetical protein
VQAALEIKLHVQRRQDLVMFILRYHFSNCCIINDENEMVLETLSNLNIDI